MNRLQKITFALAALTSAIATAAPSLSLLKADDVSEVHLIVGNSPIRLGHGVKVFGGLAIGDTAVCSLQPAVSSAPTLSTPGSGTDYDILVIDDVEKLTKELSYSISSSGKFGSVSAAASYGFESMISESALDTYILVKYINISRVESLDGSERVLPQLRSSPALFRDTIGEYYVKNITYGTRFIALLKYSFRSRDEKQKVTASLAIGAGKSNTEASLKSSLEKLEQHSHFQCKVSTTLNLPSSFDSIDDFMQAIGTMIKEGANAARAVAFDATAVPLLPLSVYDPNPETIATALKEWREAASLRVMVTEIHDRALRLRRALNNLRLLPNLADEASVSASWAAVNELRSNCRNLDEKIVANAQEGKRSEVERFVSDTELALARLERVNYSIKGIWSPVVTTREAGYIYNQSERERVIEYTVESHEKWLRARVEGRIKSDQQQVARAEGFLPVPSNECVLAMEPLSQHLELTMPKPEENWVLDGAKGWRRLILHYHPSRYRDKCTIWLDGEMTISFTLIGPVSVLPSTLESLEAFENVWELAPPNP
jgi:hypothetical protein